MKGTFALIAVAACMFQGILAGGSRGMEDGSSSSDDNGPQSVGPMLSRSACRCSSRFSTVLNYCTGRTGLLSIGCSESNTYLQCVDATCSILTCPTGQVWNATASSCAACPAGFHVDARNRRCVCNSGTTWNSTLLQCVACPTGATILPDACGCSRSLVLNRLQNACVACPVNSRVDDGTCKCTNTSLFYNSATGACEPCPGTWVQASPFRRPVCQCSGAPFIFDRMTVSCYSCPAGTTAIMASNGKRGDFCNCNVYGAKFNQATGCTCPMGQSVNVVRGVCEVTPVVVNPIAPTASTTLRQP